MVGNAGKQLPRATKSKKTVLKELGYFEGNAAHMRYAEFRAKKCFVGSGVIEAGCRTVVGERLKQSGMHWSVRGANAILALRCCILSGASGKSLGLLRYQPRVLVSNALVRRSGRSG